MLGGTSTLFLFALTCWAIVDATETSDEDNRNASLTRTVFTSNSTNGGSIGFNSTLMLDDFETNSSQYSHRDVLSTHGGSMMDNNATDTSNVPTTESEVITATEQNATVIPYRKIDIRTTSVTDHAINVNFTSNFNDTGHQYSNGTGQQCPSVRECGMKHAVAIWIWTSICLLIFTVIALILALVIILLRKMPHEEKEDMSVECDESEI